MKITSNIPDDPKIKHNWYNQDVYAIYVEHLRRYTYNPTGSYSNAIYEDDCGIVLYEGSEGLPEYRLQIYSEDVAEKEIISDFILFTTTDKETDIILLVRRSKIYR